ncbi:MAG: hypothetical protein HQK50_07015 [Oligoflexia bacterium]|nr:hypothetical protein [Oligoflexia bacterium]MBF0365305.1 hypothetical protein [Oligoflexia bacterium]
MENTKDKGQLIHDLRKSLRRMKLILDGLDSSNNGTAPKDQFQLDKMKKDFSDEILNIKNIWDLDHENIR